MSWMAIPVGDVSFVAVIHATVRSDGMQDELWPAVGGL
jgi:hypothetical protein